MGETVWMNRSGIMPLLPWGSLFCVWACWKHTQHTGNTEPHNMTSTMDVDGEFLEDLHIVHVEKSTFQYFNQSQGQNLGWEAWLQSDGCYVQCTKKK